MEFKLLLLFLHSSGSVQWSQSAVLITESYSVLFYIAGLSSGFGCRASCTTANSAAEFCSVLFDCTVCCSVQCYAVQLMFSPLFSPEDQIAVNGTRKAVHEIWNFRHFSLHPLKSAPSCSTTLLKKSCCTVNNHIYILMLCHTCTYNYMVYCAIFFLEKRKQSWHWL
jgi:hypothetical protein